MSERWIDVAERLPKPGEYVLWALKQPTVFPVVQEGYYEPWQTGQHFWRSTREPSAPRSFAEVTHWSFMPDPPSGASR